MTALAVAASGAASAEGPTVRYDAQATVFVFPADSDGADAGFSDVSGLTGGARLMWEGGEGPLRFDFHLGINARSGTLAEFEQAFVAAGPPATLFDLGATLFDEPRFRSEALIDRASVTYTTDALVLKAGRQAITWGGGLVFRPFDVVAPFRPEAIDTAYKPGADMIYGQILFDNGADVQAIWAPRPMIAGGDIDPDASTTAALASFFIGGSFSTSSTSLLDRLASSLMPSCG